MAIPHRLAVPHAGTGAADPSADAARIGAAWVERFVKLVRLQASHRVLDIGCGPGRMAIAIGDRFGFQTPYVGFDITPKDIAFCQAEISKRYPNFEFRHFDIHNGFYNPKGKLRPVEARFPVERGTIDFCFATSVFTHIWTAETRHYIAETFASLAPRGEFLATYYLVGLDLPRERLTGNAKFAFEHRHDQHCLFLKKNEPEKAVAYEFDFLRDCYEQLGFEDLRVVPGGWHGLDGAESGQDIVIARRP